MSDKLKRIQGSGGGSDQPEQYVPVEQSNTLQTKSIYRVIDLIGEGEIEGLVNGHKSIYLDDIPLQADDGSYNFEGITVQTREGTPDQSHIAGFPSVETPRSVGVELTVANGTVTRVVSDPNVDAVYIVVTVASLFHQEDNGDLNGTSVSFSIQINSEPAVTKTISDKTMSPAQLTYRIPLPAGGAPWDIKLTRVTPDAPDSKTHNSTFFTSYTEIIDHKIKYMDSAVVAAELDAELFGQHIPVRSYHIKALKVMIPTGYTPPYKDSNGVWQPAVYPGTWDGTFQAATYTSNPAWCLYDLITNKRYGAGLENPGANLKWELYPIAQRCDELIDDGFGGVEPRYTLNCSIRNQQEAYALINQLVNTFTGMSWWGPGSVMVSQDAPGNAQIIASPTNVIGGEFVYEGTDLRDRPTVCMVTWNDPDDHFRPAIEVVENKEALLKYGYKPVELAPIGCTSRGQAHRFGRWAVYTPYLATQLVHYTAGLDHSFITPGKLIAVADPFYANKNFSGLVAGAPSTTSITLDRGVKLAAGETYDLWCTMPDGTLENRTIATASDDAEHTNIQVTSGFSDVPQVESVFTVAGSDVQHRLFVCLSNTETEIDDGIAYTITGLFYDPTKYALIEQGIVLEKPNYTAPSETGVILPPNNVTLALGTFYADGKLKNNIVMSWESSTDSRVVDYVVQYKIGTDAPWQDLTTGNLIAELPEVHTAHYYFHIRAISRTGASSVWVSVDLDVPQNAMPNVTGLKLVDGADATTFNGGDAKFAWDSSSLSAVASPGGVDAWFESYVVEIRKGGSLVRTEYPKTPEYTYSYDTNKLDGGASRSFEISVYQKGNLGQLSSNPAVLAVSNPAPSMAGYTPTVTDNFKGIAIDWTNWSTTDNDFKSFKIYIDETAATTLVQEVSSVTKRWLEPNLTVGTNYKVKIVPVDAFGDGTGSDVGSGTALILDGADVDAELTGSITMSDSDGSTKTELDTLYDRVTDSGGITYTLVGTEKFIQYKFGIEDYIDKVIVYCGSTAAQVYIRYSSDGATWNYLEAESDHTLTAEDDLVAGSSGTAGTNFWQLSTGLNVAKFPDRVTAKYCELVMVGNYTTTIFELVFVREVIAEQIVADNLSAISTKTGVLYSDNYIPVVSGYMLNGVGGVADFVDMTMTFSSPATRTNAQTALNVADGADRTANNTAAAIAGQGALATLDSADYSTHVSGDSKPIIFNFSGYTYANTTHLLPRGVYDGEGTLIYDATATNTGRSYQLHVWDRATNVWISHTNYDVYGDTTKATALADALNALNNDKIVIIVGEHAPARNRTLGGLPDAIYRCGGSRTVFINEDWSGGPTYMVAGYPGMGEGTGLESFAPATIGWLEMQITIVNGSIVGLQNTPYNVSPDADVTSANTAAAIAGQGALATLDSADYSTHISGTKPPANADATNPVLQAGTTITAGGVTLNGGSGKFIVKDAAGVIRVQMGYLP